MTTGKRGRWVMGVVLAIIGCLVVFQPGYADAQGRGNGNGPRPGKGPGNNKAGEPPVARADEATTPESTTVTINVVENDSDPDNDLDPSTVDLDTSEDGIQATATTARGSYSADATGIVTFTPAAEFNGSAVLPYTVNDLNGNVSNPANITVVVEAVNIPPVASDDSGNVVNDTDVEINILANDSDSDGTLDTSKVDINIESPGIQKNFRSPEGDWSVNKGVVKFRPKADYVGIAAIQYVVYDDENAPSNAATISITVTSANVAPVAVNDTGGTTLNKPTTVDVVANDTDSDGTIDVTKVDLNTTANGIQRTASSLQGTWSVDVNGVVTYTPLALFLGTATLRYTVMDDKGAVSNVATISITVQAINIAPTANNDNVTTSKNSPVTIKVTANDTDIDGTIDVTKVDLNPTLAGIQNTATSAQGNYSVDATGTVTFTPANNFTGQAAITYVVSDNAGAVSNVASINITVQNVNATPIANNDTGVTTQNTSVDINVVANDTDSDGVIDAAKVDLNTSRAGIQTTVTVAEGTFTVNNIGIVTYKPARNFTGSVQLAYTVNDNNGAVSNIATITIAVQPTNAPLAKEDVATTQVNRAIDINVVANDTDADGSVDVTSVDLDVSVEGTQKDKTTTEGNFKVNNQGVVTYTPKKDFVGNASIGYVVADDKGVWSNVAQIKVTVEAIPNQPPVIVSFEDETDTLRYTPGNPQQISDLFEAQDADTDTLAVAEIGLAADSYVAGKDKLNFVNTAKIKGTFNAQNGLLTLTGSARIPEFNAAIRSVRYEFTGKDEVNTVTKKIYVRVSDGVAFSDIQQRNVKISSSVTDLDIPTAFTPNSDGANDTWRILVPAQVSGSGFADAQIRVYDKRGSVVFDSIGFENTWDGTYQGKQLPVDSYYYVIDLKQAQKRYKGVVAILR